MATTTTNFGWDIPQSTDLVKDGATAIAALGQDIDTAFVDLKGGTTGQVLAKASNTDLDYTWTTPEVGDITAVTAGTGLTGGGTSGAVSLAFDQANYGGGQYAAGKNKIINGDFGIWQRGTSFSGSTYNADRWVSLTDATVTTSQQTFTAGTAPVAGYEGTYFQRTAKSAGGSYTIQEQRIEDVRVFAGQTVSLSFWAKADANVSCSPSFAQFFNGSATVDTILSSVTITTTWARYSFTVALPGISGKTIGSGNYLAARPIRVLGSAATTIDLWGVQLEASNTATAFQTATGTIQGETSACQRYYWRAGGNVAYEPVGAMGAGYSTTQTAHNFTFPVEMRVAPSSIDFSTIAVSDVVSAPISCSNVILTADKGRKTAQITTSTAGGITAGRPYQIITNNSTSGFLAFNAEL